MDHLLAESESVKYFVAERVQRVVGGAGLATEELVTAYMKYCDERNLAPLRHQAGRTRSPGYHDVNPWRPCWQPISCATANGPAVTPMWLSSK